MHSNFQYESAAFDLSKALRKRQGISSLSNAVELFKRGSEVLCENAENVGTLHAGDDAILCRGHRFQCSQMFILRE